MIVSRIMVDTISGVVSTIVTFLSMVSNRTTVAVTVSGRSSISGGFDLLIGYFNHFGLFSVGCKHENS